jgi:uncharacterized membrane protein YjfL (UPF0719 family)
MQISDHTLSRLSSVHRSAGATVNNEKIIFAFNSFFLGLALMNFINQIESFPSFPFWAALAGVLLFSSFVVIMLRTIGKSLFR